jgi:hypothetical protein
MLILHLLGAFITFLVCVYAWFKPEKRLISLLSFCALFEVFSGSWISLAAAHSLNLYCSKIALYLLVIFVTQLHLLRTTHTAWPAATLYAHVFSGLIIAATLVAL